MDKKIEHKQLDVQQLVEAIVDYKRELFSLRIARVTSHVKDSSQFKKLRRNIARAMTALRQKA